ncbi:hypothetical protein ESA94_08435 [Lacibacter luteus]|uniref:Uncharacterized protein n=1 Tax=Lacibacter luteus TaxID=2508719 RepID=A0A4Q1CJF5_9BACT|nr:hypothetical protein [Lacibacter luteus]RXK60487.1 hypothetical protein ESA94_08435 [Lacibacter luteus]
MKKYIISIFLSLVLSIQLLPLAQISAAMYQSQQMTEELPHNDTPPTPSFTEEIHKHFVTVTNEELIHLTELRVTELIHHAEKVYTRFSDDVQTRPPNAC